MLPFHRIDRRHQHVGLGLLERLARYTAHQTDPQACRLWLGAVSLSGYRRTYYPIIVEDFPSRRRWRVNRLVLLLKTAPAVVIRDADEPLEQWLARANRWFATSEAAHTCDTSLCVHADHLEWKSHADNLAEQRERRRRQA